MTWEKAEFHEASGHIFGEVQAIQRAGFTFFQVSQRLGRNWGISPIRSPVDTQLHRGISIRLVLKHAKFPKASERLALPRIIPDHFGPRYENLSKIFRKTAIDNNILRFYTSCRVK